MIELYFAQLFTNCMEIFHKSVGLTFQGIQATSVPNIDDKYSLARFEKNMVPDCSSPLAYING